MSWDIIKWLREVEIITGVITNCRWTQAFQGSTEMSNFGRLALIGLTKFLKDNTREPKFLRTLNE